MRNEEEKLLKLVQNLIQIDSSDPGAYEGEIGIFITNWLRSHVPNAIIETQEVLPGRHNIRAVLPGKISHPALVFICHMDTVTLGDGWKKSTPLSGELLEGKIYGRGACDMKSGLACALSAFARAGALAAQGQHPNHSLVLIASVDEEDFMRDAEKAIVSEWVTENDWVLDAEPTNGEIRMAHKGRTWFQVSVEGVTAHASTPYKGADAIAGIAEIITRIRNEILAAPVHEELGNSTVTFGMINGGYRPYVVPDKANVWIDMRLVPPLTPECAKDIVARAISQAEKLVPGIRGFYTITGNRPYVQRNPHSLLLSSLGRSIRHVTGQEAVVGVFPGYTDTAVIAGTLHNTNCMSYGPGNLELAHKPDESVDIADILRCEKVFTHLITQMLYKDLTETPSGI